MKFHYKAIQMNDAFLYIFYVAVELENMYFLAQMKK